MKTRPIPTQESRPFELHEKFFSVTDAKGLIRSCNEVFLRVAEYAPSEILGEPHNIIRHPDMPRCVFKLLWDYLLSGKPIGAYVKNISKNGGYYWVFAVAAPLGDGFYSIRIKPTSPIFDEIPTLYASLLEHESSFGERWREGMASAGERLMETLGKLGFGSYDAFMSEALRREFAAHLEAVEEHRRHAISERPGEESFYGDSLSREGDPVLRNIFRSLPIVAEAGRTLRERRGYFSQLDTVLHNLAINAAVQAEHVGVDGASLGVISREIGGVSKRVAGELQRLIEETEAISVALGEASFSSSMTLLQTEMSRDFSAVAQDDTAEEGTHAPRYGMELDQIQKLLSNAAEASTLQFTDATASLSSTLARFDSFITFLSRTIQTLEFSYVVGRTLCAGLHNADGFSHLLDQLAEVARSACSGLEEINRSVQAVRDKLPKGLRYLSA